MYAWLVAVALGLSSGSANEQTARIDLYREGRYFEFLRVKLDGASKAEDRFLNGFIQIGLGKLSQGIRSLEQVQRKLPRELELAAIDHRVIALGRLGRYREAERLALQTLDRKRLFKSDEKRRDMLNHARLWGALRHIPPMRVEKSGDSMLKSPSGTFCELPFRSNGKEFSLGGDTGANLSLVREGLARQMGLRMIPADIEVGTISGEKVRPWLGVAKELVVGRAKVSNAVFLVMRDKDLYFPQAKFQLDGVIGLPILMMLEEVTFLRDGTTHIPLKPGTSGSPNLFLSGLKLFAEGDYGGQKLPFALDTGASDTLLYPPFYRRFKADVDARGFPLTHSVFGVAGPKATAAYLLMDVDLTFAGRKARLDTAQVITQVRDESSRRFYGNVGRDLLSQFESATFNWRSMRMTLGKPVGP